ncbi:hypothetical protein M434DRAFT_395861 [Hypoxylon sp. CO27-5]|nr:hypothetical protein M434DRAFT_395861 [Hypoxylon sp. CO27-5]
MEPLGFKDLTVQNREAVELFELLYSITECINNFDYASLESTYGQRIQVSDSIYMIEWRLCHLEEISRSRQSWKRAGSVPLLPSIEEGERPPRYPSPTDLSDVLIYAAHLFLHLAIRGQPPSAQRHRALAEALMSALCDPILTLDLLSQPKAYEVPGSQVSRGNSGQVAGQSGTGNLPTPYAPTSEISNVNMPRPSRDELHANILLWALFVGSCVRVPVSLDSSVLLGNHHEFFINALRNYCRMRNIVDKDTLAEKLKDIMWLYSWCEHQLTLVWNEIGNDLRPWVTAGEQVNVPLPASRDQREQSQ